MENYIKIDRDVFDSVIREHKHQNKKQIDLIEDISDSIINKSVAEVSTYTEKEFLYEKRRYLMGKSIANKIDKVELKMLEDLTNLLREMELAVVPK